MRDQLDRFGEIDHTAELLHEIAKNTIDRVVTNREDKRLSNIDSAVFFGLSDKTRKVFKEDDDLLEASAKTNKKPRHNASVILEDMKDDEVYYNIGKTKLKLGGVYNAFNAAGALALVKEILPEVSDDIWLEKLSEVKPAFGRGEKIGDMEIVLVKNPSGFQLALESFDKPNAVMIAITDEYADGRDVSWLWNVDFSSVKNLVGARSVAREIITSGNRSADMALRLKYEDIKVAANEPDLKKALAILNEKPGEKYIFCTYTAMLKIRKILTGRTIS
jgi:UDP-N-acetylmuramyl tripeptide synthase